MEINSNLTLSASQPSRRLRLHSRRDCNPNWGCPDCGGWPPDPSCPFRRLGCEADKVRYRGQCEVEKAAARAACESNAALQKGQCELGKAAFKLGCDFNQGW